MGESPLPPARSRQHRSRDAAQVTAAVIELLEVLWEQGRDAASTQPVSASQLRVLYSLDREDGMNLRTLGEALNSAPSSVSRLCDRLQALGFVERSPSPVSRRELELHLTPRGSDYLRDLRLRREEALTATIATMPPRARTALLEGLKGFRDAAEGPGAAAGGPVAVHGDVGDPA